MIVFLLPQSTVAQENAPKENQTEGTYLGRLEARLESPKRNEVVLALKKLGEIGRKRHVSLLKEQYRNGESQVKMVALEAITQIPLNRVDQFLKKIIRKERSPYNHQAARYLRKRLGKESIPFFLELLSADSRVLREVGIQSLFDITGFRFQFHPNETINARRTSIEQWKRWWQKHRTMGLVHWWIKVLEQNEGNVFRIIQAQKRLVDRRDVRVLPYLIDHLRSSELSLRVQAQRSLRRMTVRSFGFDPFADKERRNNSVRRWEKWWSEHRDSPRAQWLVERFFEDISRKKRRTVMQELTGLSQRKKIISRLLSRMNAEDRNKWEEGIRTLRRITYHSFGDSLQVSEEERRRILKRWKKWWEDHRSLTRTEWMERALIEGEIQNRIQAAKYFGSVRNKDHVRLLIHFGLLDPAQNVREEALHSLRAITGRSMRINPEASPGNQRKKIAKWKNWLGERWDEIYGDR